MCGGCKVNVPDGALQVCPNTRDATLSKEGSPAAEVQPAMSEPEESRHGSPHPLQYNGRADSARPHDLSVEDDRRPSNRYIVAGSIASFGSTPGNRPVCRFAVGRELRYRVRSLNTPPDRVVEAQRSTLLRRFHSRLSRSCQNWRYDRLFAWTGNPGIASGA